MTMSKIPLSKVVMIIFNVKSALFYYVATRDSSSRKPRFYLELINNIHCGSTKVMSRKWLPRWRENLKQAVKYEGYLRRKSVY